jgi:hypothetical protein
MANEKDDHEDGYLPLPAASGGGALVRRSQICGSRANGAEGAIVYLAAGPSVYTTATVPQLGRILGAEVAELRRE